MPGNYLDMDEGVMPKKAPTPPDARDWTEEEMANATRATGLLGGATATPPDELSKLLPWDAIVAAVEGKRHHTFISLERSDAENFRVCIKALGAECQYLRTAIRSLTEEQDALDVAFRACDALKAQYAARVGELEAKLRTALDHIEHMGAHIMKSNNGYSFESLGEDIADLRKSCGWLEHLERRSRG